MMRITYIHHLQQTRNFTVKMSVSVFSILINSVFFTPYCMYELKWTLQQFNKYLDALFWQYCIFKRSFRCFSHHVMCCFNNKNVCFPQLRPINSVSWVQYVFWPLDGGKKPQSVNFILNRETKKDLKHTWQTVKSFFCSLLKCKQQPAAHLTFFPLSLVIFNLICFPLMYSFSLLHLLIPVQWKTKQKSLLWW